VNTYPMYNLTIAASSLTVMSILSGFFNSCDPFLRILKKNHQYENWDVVYESEVIRNSSNASF
jgi:hypothetical protein